MKRSQTTFFGTLAVAVLSAAWISGMSAKDEQQAAIAAGHAATVAAIQRIKPRIGA